MRIAAFAAGPSVYLHRLTTIGYLWLACLALLSLPGPVDARSSKMTDYINAAGRKLFLSVTSGQIFHGLLTPSILTGTALGDVLHGWSGADRLIGLAGDDTYHVSSKDAVIIEAASGGVDTVVTNAWTSFVLPDHVENLMVRGDNYAIGNELDNIIIGDSGCQTIAGRGGFDVLVGDGGRDTFLFTRGDGADVIADFTAGDSAERDILRVSGFAFYTLSDVVDALEQVGNDSVLRLSATEHVIFRDSQVGDFTAGNFQLQIDRSRLVETFADDFDVFDSSNRPGLTWRTEGAGLPEWESYWTFTVENPVSSIFVNDRFGGNRNGVSWNINPFSVSDGLLSITASHLTPEQSALAWGHQFASGMINTRDSFAQTYGYFEMRAGLPAGQGLWPAFWLLPLDGRWPPEIDVMEMLGHDPALIYATVHTEASGSHTSSGTGTYVGDTSDGSHTYGLLWGPEEIVWYFDETEIFRAPTPADMHQPMYLIANLAVGGDWAGAPAAGSPLGTMTIDYIKAYSFDPANTESRQPDAQETPARVLTGTLANDTFVVANSLTTILERPDGGRDLVKASVDYALGANLENLTLTGTAALTGHGNALANYLTGNVGNNTLFGMAGDDYIDGGAGADTMAGGRGNDIYVVDAYRDRVIELSGEGTDGVNAYVNFTLPNHVENLTLKGIHSLSATGNDLANLLIGNAAGNTLYGLGGDDFLDGGVGADRMFGGAGDDVYVVDNISDLVREMDGEGIDGVRASVSYTLPDLVENLTLTGAANLSGVGNGLANILAGNAGANILMGLGGDDNIFGAAGDDHIDGGAGADRMVGGLGNDVYVVNSARDTIVERGGEGVDGVRSSISYELDIHLENLTLTGTASLSGTGNSSDNFLTGTAGSNVLMGLAGNDYLDGGAGADTMVGGTGNDVYVVDSAGDVVREYAGQGIDGVRSSISQALGDHVENLALTGSADLTGTGTGEANYILGNAGANRLRGLEGNDHLNGGDGDDILIGGGGDDVLIGGSENDLFLFQAFGGNDRIEDMSHGDRIAFDGQPDLAALSMQQQGSHVLLTLNGYGSVLILHAQVDALHLSGGYITL
jgi:Ca2+-binding RTX toxin-like protein